ncbi:hypothetical protein L6R52_34640, partial [Myxococcota bacterium]|nr:hypothetical protein [Myxococcota bacterium]
SADARALVEGLARTALAPTARAVLVAQRARSTGWVGRALSEAAIHEHAPSLGADAESRLVRTLARLKPEVGARLAAVVEVMPALLARTHPELDAKGEKTALDAIERAVPRRATAEQAALDVLRALQGGSDADVARDALRHQLPLVAIAPWATRRPPDRSSPVVVTKTHVAYVAVVAEPAGAERGRRDATPRASVELCVIDRASGVERSFPIEASRGTAGANEVVDVGGKLAVRVAGSTNIHVHDPMLGTTTRHAAPPSGDVATIFARDGALCAVTRRFGQPPVAYQSIAGVWQPLAQLRAQGALLVAPRGESQLVAVDTVQGNVDVRLVDLGTKTTTALPPIPERGFVPVSIDAGRDAIHVFGPNAVFTLDTTSMTRWERASLDDRRVFTGGTDAVVVGDATIGTELGVDLAAVPTTEAPTERKAGRAVDRSRAATQKAQLARMSLDQLGARPVVDRASADALLVMLTDLARDGLLSVELRKAVDGAFATWTVDDGAAAAFRDRWFGAGHGTIDGARFDVIAEASLPAGGAASDATSEGRRAALARITAMAAALDDGTSKLLALLAGGRVGTDAATAVFDAATLLLERKIDAAIAKRAITTPETAAITADAIALRAAATALRARIDDAVTRLALLAAHTDDSASALRAYTRDGLDVSPRALRLGLAHFEGTGAVSLAELRALTALTDATGTRSADASVVLERLAKLRLTPGAREKLPVVLAGPTTAESLEGPDRAALGKVDGSGPLVVWANENRTASAGRTFRVGIDAAIRAERDGLFTDRIHVSGRTVLDRADGHVPHPSGARATSDAFDQVNLLWTANHVLERLAAVGLDLDALQRGEPNGGKVRMIANGMDDMNAYYSPLDNELVFGTSNDEWHLAADADVVAHELGHYALDHLQPNLMGGEGRAIHEGFGDALSAFLFDDPELSEDFPRDARSARDARENKFLRTVENTATISGTSAEEHDRGLVYGGYAWSVKTALATIISDDTRAAELMFAVLARHGVFYTTSSVTSEDFHVAMVASAREYLKTELSPDQLTALEAKMNEEATRRELVPASGARSASPLATVVNDALRGALGYRDRPSLEELAAHLGRAIGVDRRTDVAYEAVKTVTVGDVSKHVFRAVAKSPTGESLPLEDGYVAVLVRDGVVERVDGRGTNLPATFDWRPLGPSLAQATESALQHLPRAIARAGLVDAELKRFARDQLPGLVAAKRVEAREVLHGGKRALALTTRLGQFVVGRDGELVAASRLAYV